MFSKNTTAYVFLLFAALFWSGNFIVGKAASLFEIPPFTLNFYRWLFAWLILAPFTLREIFEQKKELYFRKIEREYLNELINKDEHKVISLGGGTPCYSDNMDLILNTSNSDSIYLNRSIDFLVERLYNKISSRPLIAHLKSKEELKEFQEAINNKDLLEIADALTDILYVTYGAGHSFGINLDKCFAEVQRSNMSKLGKNGQPIYNEHGKVMKGPNYFKPNLKQFI